MRLLRPKNARSGWLVTHTLAWTCLATPALLNPWVGQRAYCQEAAAPTYRTKNLDATLCNDAKLKEKNEKLKPETFDIAGIEAYYQSCIFARLAQPSAESMNRARVEILADIDLIERRAKQSPEMLTEYNRMLMRQIKEILSKDNEGDRKSVV